MPSTFDNTYHARFVEPVYDTEADRRKFQSIREADEIYELKTPGVPTQDQENAYLDFLEDSFKSDPWVTVRFRKYMAGPKRLPWQNQREIQRTYKYTFLVHWLMGGLLAWPVGVFVGRRMKMTQGGVPITPVQRFVHDFPNLEPSRLARKTFTWWSIGTAVALGYLFAKATTNPQTMQNTWYNRPDLKPYPAMVHHDEGYPRDVTNETMKQSLYKSHQAANAGQERKRSAWYRYFWSPDADWTVKENPYESTHKHDVFNSRQSLYSSLTNDFWSHMQK